jgi:eukaryotic-like serine/threonine-protein kinase
MVAVERFGTYVVHESIGTGGMATVHRATIDLDGGGEREVALKRLHPELAEDRRFVDDLVREAKLAGRLSHPNIVRILDLGRIGPTYFIAMELVHGRSLLAMLRKALLQKRPAPIGVVLAIAAELLDALDYAHTAEHGGIVHRDLSPSNLLITDDGHLKIIDFGIARPIQARMPTGGNVVKGKLGYVAPEALRGDVLDGRADVFSAGIVMWELLACKRLFKARDPREMIAMIAETDVPPPSQLNADCPPELDEIVMCAATRAVEDRWQSAAAMRRALETVRRRHRDRAGARQVASWCQRLRAESAVTGARGRTRSDLHRLSTDDIRPIADAIDRLDETNPYVEIRVVRSRTVND